MAEESLNKLLSGLEIYRKDDGKQEENKIISFSDAGLTIDDFDDTRALIRTLSSYFNAPKECISIIIPCKNGFIVKSGYNADVIDSLKGIREYGCTVTYQKRGKDAYWRITKKEECSEDNEAESIDELIDIISCGYSISLIADINSSVFIVHQAFDTPDEYGGITLFSEPVKINPVSIWKSISDNLNTERRKVDRIYLADFKNGALSFSNIDANDDEFKTIHPIILLRVSYDTSKPAHILYSTLSNKVSEIGWMGSSRSKKIISYMADKLRRMGTGSILLTKYDESNKYIITDQIFLDKCKRLFEITKERIGVSDRMELCFEDIDLIPSNGEDVRRDPLAYVYDATLILHKQRFPFLDEGVLPVIVGQNMFLEERTDDFIVNTCIHEISHYMIDLYFDGNSWTDGEYEKINIKDMFKMNQPKYHGNIFDKIMELLLSYKYSYNDIKGMDVSELMGLRLDN